jgi:nucleoside-diphosphate-sugar epimerase
MKIFLTGATGFIGSALVPELINAEYEVLGLARSDASAHALIAAGAQVHRGSLEDLKSLRDGASQSDGVIHCAYNNDLSDIEKTSRQETEAIETLGAGLKGSNRPLIITSVAAMGAAKPRQVATEEYFSPNTLNPRKATEIAGQAAEDCGVNVSVVRLSQVHNTVKLVFGSHLLQVAREKGVSAYIVDGANRWAVFGSVLLSGSRTNSTSN